MTRKPLEGELMEFTPEQLSKLRDGSMRGVSMRLDIGTPNGDSTAIYREARPFFRPALDKMRKEWDFDVLYYRLERKRRSVKYNNGKPLQCLQCGASCGPNGELPPCGHGD